MIFAGLLLALCFVTGLAVQPRQSTCASIPNYMSGNRIVGGQAAPSPIPWQASIRQCQSGGCHFCGGTILDERTVMCAAHCFNQGQSMSGYYVAVGITNRNDGTSGQIIAIANGVWNNAMPYNSQTSNNDYVILKLASALSFNANVQPACLPDSSSYAPESSGQVCFVSGWGTLSSGSNSLPTALQWVGVPLITNAKCSNSYSGITSSMICAGYPEGGKDSCQGDSGGPLVCNQNGKAVLTGVVSFGIGCALPNYPGVYSRITAVLDWIKANMENGGGNPPAPPPPTTPPPFTGCLNPNWQGDTWCDDENNNPECNYDGGDCCGDNVQTQYCSACQCLDPSFATTTQAPPAPSNCPAYDANPSWYQDRYCDDSLNTAECGYDGGDCCFSKRSGWNKYCSQCECKGANCPQYVKSWWRDNYCDDSLNTPGCFYDAGDCCLKSTSSWNNYCSDCLCLDPFGN